MVGRVEFEDGRSLFRRGVIRADAVDACVPSHEGFHAESFLSQRHLAFLYEVLQVEDVHAAFAVRRGEDIELVARYGHVGCGFGQAECLDGFKVGLVEHVEVVVSGRGMRNDQQEVACRQHAVDGSLSGQLQLVRAAGIDRVVTVYAVSGSDVGKGTVSRQSLYGIGRQFFDESLHVFFAGFGIVCFHGVLVAVQQETAGSLRVGGVDDTQLHLFFLPVMGQVEGQGVCDVFPFVVFIAQFVLLDGVFVVARGLYAVQIDSGTVFGREELATGLTAFRFIISQAYGVADGLEFRCFLHDDEDGVGEFRIGP